MTSPEHPMLAHLVDLESPFEPSAERGYDPVELVRYALGTTDYWAELALLWLDHGVDADRVLGEVTALENHPGRPQALRHHARRVRKRD